MYLLSVISGLAFAGFILLNMLAYRHAYAMLHFTDAGVRTQKPESLAVFNKIRILFAGVTIPRPMNRSTPADVGLAFTTHRIQSSGNIELEGWYIPCRQAKDVVVLFHGYSSSKSSLLEVAKGLNDIGYSTFLIDFRGSGGSDRRSTSVGYYEADDVISTVEYVQKTAPGTHVILYGQSMGGASILRAISARGLRPDLLIIEGVFDRMLTTVKARFSAMGVPSFPSAYLLTFWGGQQMGFSAFDHNPEDYARAVDCPVLVLHGEKYPRATIDQATRIFRNLKEPKQLELFTGVGHDSCYAAAPEKWIQVVSEFIGKNLTKRAGGAPEGEGQGT